MFGIWIFPPQSAPVSPIGLDIMQGAKIKMLILAWLSYIFTPMSTGRLMSMQQCTPPTCPTHIYLRAPGAQNRVTHV